MLTTLPAVSLDSLSAQQLTAVKKQLDEEVEHLTTSFAQLQSAQIKFRDCLRCVKAQGATPGEQSCQETRIWGESRLALKDSRGRLGIYLSVPSSEKS